MRVLRFLAALFLVLPLLFSTTASSQSQSDSDAASSSTSSGAGEDESDQRNQRVEQRKQTLQIQLSGDAAQAVGDQCQAAQVKLRRVEFKAAGFSLRREAAYQDLLTRLSDLNGKLKVSGVDTQEYSSQIEELDSRVNAFYGAANQFETAVGDAANMDCANDPEGFLASLEDARAQRAQVVNSSQAIINYLQNSIKSTLKNARNELANQQGGSQ